MSRARDPSAARRAARVRKIRRAERRADRQVSVPVLDAHEPMGAVLPHEAMDLAGKARVAEVAAAQLARELQWPEPLATLDAEDVASARERAHCARVKALVACREAGTTYADAARAGSERSEPESPTRRADAGGMEYLAVGREGDMGPRYRKPTGLDAVVSGRSRASRGSRRGGSVSVPGVRMAKVDMGRTGMHGQEPLPEPRGHASGPTKVPEPGPADAARAEVVRARRLEERAARRAKLARNRPAFARSQARNAARRAQATCFRTRGARVPSSTSRASCSETVSVRAEARVDVSNQETTRARVVEPVAT